MILHAKINIKISTSGLTLLSYRLCMYVWIDVCMYVWMDGQLGGGRDVRVYVRVCVRVHVRDQACVKLFSFAIRL